MRNIAVQCRDRKAACRELFRKLFGGLLGTRKDQHRVEGFRFEDPGQGVEFMDATDKPIALANVLGSRGFCRDGDFFGIAQMGLGNFSNTWRHGGREQRNLAFGRRLLQDALDVVNEAHAQHFVGFVEHHPAQFGQVQ